MSALKTVFSLTLLALPMGCGADTSEEPSTYLPVMQWDFHEQGPDWTQASMDALESHGAALTDTVPNDIATWCPAYPEASAAERRAFWTGLLSALAKYESTWNPQAVGGGGQWFGLVQISPATARGYGCRAKSGLALQDGEANLSCAIRIMATTVTRDNAVAFKEDGRRGGVAADWGPFVSAEKRESMAAWTSSQSYCSL
ncbi:transglycosylase SLT domain-containing protein [Pseudaestuariivita rosea]|uniref:transglycosylase SLT domain-containing protein n=1 Tax=Pseudaestuariivita rosea TaxID=2763263 RepID=UPI001ABA757E|nr:transglycosylase SLT domain-containing protein [Pseudaestuariivita rosea]